MEWQDPTWTGEADYDPVDNPRAPGRVEYHEDANGTSGRVGYIDQDGQYISEDLERGPTTAFDTYLFGFEANYDLEPLGDYEPGGYHPTHLGDALGPSDDLDRYTVLHKLGHGSLYTVWLCRDHRVSQLRYVALKIMKADVSREELMEHRLDSLEDYTTLGREYIAFPLNKFALQGPNGAHQCMVFEVLGHGIGPGLWMEWDKERDSRAPMVLRKMAYQATRAMAFLHKNNICHGDFRPANIRVKLRGLDELSEPEIMQLFGQPKSVSVRSLPTATNLEHQPKYLVHAYNSGCLKTDPLDPKHVSDEIAVTGFGNAFYATAPPERLSGDFRFQPPEFLLGPTVLHRWAARFIGFPSGLWALGWTLVCIRAQRQFFQTIHPDVDRNEYLSMVGNIFGFEGRRGFNHVHLHGEIRRIEPFWWEYWEEGSNRFNNRGVAFPGALALLFDGDGVVEKVLEGLGSIRPEGGMLEEALYQQFRVAGDRLFDIYPFEVEFLGDLARQLCHYSPSKRIPAEEAADHRFFEI